MEIKKNSPPLSPTDKHQTARRDTLRENLPATLLPTDQIRK